MYASDMRRSLTTLLGTMALAGLALALPACAADSESGPGGDDAVEGDVQDFTTGPKLQYDEYSVLFTNPVCKKYSYPTDANVQSNAGEPLTHKPENVFCAQADAIP